MIFCGDYVGRREVGGIFERFVFEHEDVEVNFISLDEIVVGDAPSRGLCNQTL